MNRLKVYRIILLAVTLLVFAATALGQTAQVTGRVTDASGAVMPGAQVILINQANGFKRETVTNGEGYYTVPLIRRIHETGSPFTQFATCAVTRRARATIATTGERAKRPGSPDECVVHCGG